MRLYFFFLRSSDLFQARTSNINRLLGTICTLFDELQFKYLSFVTFTLNVPKKWGDVQKRILSQFFKIIQLSESSTKRRAIFLVVKLIKQQFKHAESTTRSRTCRKLLRFSILSRIFYDSLNKDLISKYFSFVLALSVIHSCWLELDYLVNPTQL